MPSKPCVMDFWLVSPLCQWGQEECSQDMLYYQESLLVYSTYVGVLFSEASQLMTQWKIVKFSFSQYFGQA